MAVEISDYSESFARLRSMDLIEPSMLAILPRNLDTAITAAELVHESSAIEIRKLWRAAGIEESKIEKPGFKIPSIAEEWFEWVAPVIFIGAAAYSQNPEIANITLNIIANYLTDWFKGSASKKNVKLSFVVEKKKKTKYVRVNYEGPACNFAEVGKAIREIIDE